MPGPWLRVRDDPDHVLGIGTGAVVEAGRLYEVDLWEADYSTRQGTGLLLAKGDACLGKMVAMKFVACSDDFYAYWFQHEASYTLTYHLCKKAAVDCQEAPEADVHVDGFRRVLPEDILEGRLRWLKGPARRRAEELAKSLQEDAPPAGAAGGKEAEGAPGEKAGGAPGGRLFPPDRQAEDQKGGLAKDIRDLREDLRDSPAARRSRSRRGRRRDEPCQDDPFAAGSKAVPERDRRREPDRRELDRRDPDRQEGTPAFAGAEAQPLAVSVARESYPPAALEGRGVFGSGSSPTGHTHMSLVEYSRTHPSRLAHRLLSKKAAATDRGEEPTTLEGAPPAAAVSYFLGIFQNSHPSLGIRNAREARTLCKALDLLAAKAYGQAADLLAQRLKAVEQATVDGHWGKAGWLELLPPEGTTLVDREEEYMTTKEEELQWKLKGGWSKGKGKDKDKAALDIEDWRKNLRGETPHAVSGAQMGRWLRGALVSMPSALGQYVRTAALRPSRGHNGAQRSLLPLPVAPLEEMVRPRALELSVDPGLAVDWTWVVVMLINFLGSGMAAEPGKESSSSQLGREPVPDGPLGPLHRQALERLVTQVLWFLAEDDVDDWGAKYAEARRRKYTYEGETISVRRELIANKVIPTWPAPGCAALHPAADFLEDPLRERYLDPYRCLKPHEEWPTSVHKSRVHGNLTEWDAIAAEGLKRGIFWEVPEDDIFVAPNGEKVLNGAMGVDKFKEAPDGEVLHLLRFITIMTPVNQFMATLEGDANKLPYLGHALLIILGSCEEALVDSEDFESCFNLFVQPLAWRGFTAYERMVSGFVKGPDCSDFRVGIRTVPMGYRGAVDLVQHLVRRLVFVRAGVAPETEVAKGSLVPTGPDYSMVVLDSFDYVRVLDKALAGSELERESPEHARFVGVCRELGLPLNVGKRLVGSYRATIQGGEFDLKLGLYAHARRRSRHAIRLSMGMLMDSAWTEGVVRHWGGLACYAASYRRPLYSVLQDIFRLLECPGELKTPNLQVLTEIITFAGLLPMAAGSLRAEVYEHISITDASPTGGGAAVAKEFSRLVPAPAWPGPEARDPCKAPYPCPARCGYAAGGLEELLAHRRKPEGPDTGPCCQALELGSFPTFVEVFSGTSAKLTCAVAKTGVEVAPPYDARRPGMPDFLEPAGAEYVRKLVEKSPILWEHWAPGVRLMLKGARSPAVRGRRHPRGLPWLRGRTLDRVRESNKMADAALARVGRRADSWGVSVLAHPCRSWLFRFPLARRLARQKGIYLAKCWVQGFGGRRNPVSVLLHNCPALHVRFHLEDGPGLEGPFATRQAQAGPRGDQLEDGYPEEFCAAYADVVQHVFLELGGHLFPRELTAQARRLRGQLQGASRRLAEEIVNNAVADELHAFLKNMRQGQEVEHLRDLCRRIDHRGSDVQLWAGELHRACRQVAPCPAFRWAWKTVAAYSWRSPQHISILEVVAFLNHVTEAAQSRRFLGKRFFHVVDSQVAAAVVAKGRSSSRSLNSQLRKLAGLLLAGDIYPLMVWALSGWNFADAQQLDYEVSEFMNHLWLDDHPEGMAADVLSALGRFLPRARDQLPISRFYVTNWRRTVQRVRVLPITNIMVCGMAGFALLDQDFGFAAAILAGFAGLLRTSEVVNLRFQDIMYLGDHGGAIPVLRGSKSGQRYNIHEKVWL
ncbi:unnamed protein product [Prorocentrum cordatum]|uniref:1,3-beta-glucan synthase n=1 Tax=Prorocentrum cordatum TaxID=2364126 RepID=A0ABN9VC28_9DINO|nr:unnamed protein product [Polarella glacialis]